MKATDINNISQEKFRLVGDERLTHDVKFDTKPHSYFTTRFTFL